MLLLFAVARASDIFCSAAGSFFTGGADSACGGGACGNPGCSMKPASTLSRALMFMVELTALMARKWRTSFKTLDPSVQRFSSRKFGNHCSSFLGLHPQVRPGTSHCAIIMSRALRLEGAAGPWTSPLAVTGT